MKKLMIVVTMGLFTFISGGVVFAEGNALDLPRVKINPGSFYYPFKRLVEKGYERVIFSREYKISFYDSLLAVRLSELKYVVDNKALSEVQTSSERFAYYAGILTEELKKQNNSEKDTQMVEKFRGYNVILEDLRDKYPANSSYSMLLQHDINSLGSYIEKLNED